MAAATLQESASAAAPSSATAEAIFKPYPIYSPADEEEEFAHAKATEEEKLRLAEMDSLIPPEFLAPIRWFNSKTARLEFLRKQKGLFFLGVFHCFLCGLIYCFLMPPHCWSIANQRNPRLF